VIILAGSRAIRQVCARFVAVCRTMGLFTEATVAIDGSKFKAVNNRDKNFTRAKMISRLWSRAPISDGPHLAHSIRSTSSLQIRSPKMIAPSRGGPDSAEKQRSRGAHL
jgi:hypothetical protein